MLKKLKRRMVLINMLFVGVILLLMSVIDIAFIYRLEMNKINDRLSKAIYFSETNSDYRRDFGDGFMPSPPFDGQSGGNGGGMPSGGMDHIETSRKIPENLNMSWSSR